jgi:hypothetical protein
VNMMVSCDIGKITGSTLAETVAQFPLGTTGQIHTFDVIGPEFSVILTGGPPKTKVLSRHGCSSLTGAADTAPPRGPTCAGAHTSAGRAYAIDINPAVLESASRRRPVVLSKDQPARASSRQGRSTPWRRPRADLFGVIRLVDRRSLSQG